LAIFGPIWTQFMSKQLKIWSGSHFWLNRVSSSVLNKGLNHIFVHYNSNNSNRNSSKSYKNLKHKKYMCIGNRNLFYNLNWCHITYKYLALPTSISIVKTRGNFTFRCIEIQPVRYNMLHEKSKLFCMPLPAIHTTLYICSLTFSFISSTL